MSDLCGYPAHTQDIALEWRENSYYARAERQDWLAPFWGEQSPFLELFGQLDTTALVDLACGHGRHAAVILARPGLLAPRDFWLIDVNSENLERCRARFADRPQIHVVQSDGFTLRPIRDAAATAIFSYDAMVHFEWDCVLSYVRDAFRVLKPGGRALLHHSNLCRPGSKWTDNPHWRNFMSKELLSHVAQRVGFQVLEQRVLDWGDEQPVSAIDCLSLLEKPFG